MFRSQPIHLRIVNDSLEDDIHDLLIYVAGFALFFLPGGLGGAEAAMVALLVAGGTMFGTAVLATVICRAVTLWFAVVIGVGAVFVLGRRRLQVY
ncbi:MAG: flippase-like domain-containing protein [Thiocapsa sp.]|uniref:lysylphosphatidylglycerol synthase domain-containing protein n=1 Tax=Thiocapsa sp. TaxID=2024551 RepID=UPI001BCE0AF6|nr:lysylphosphatidylglycerol synthase domain-containing protein [Thiocapsa sp.]QVL49596.1 MAG: flippase-like domain-containing protein [Thiocapsa sp.]